MEFIAKSGPANSMHGTGSTANASATTTPAPTAAPTKTPAAAPVAATPPAEPPELAAAKALRAEAEAKLAAAEKRARVNAAEARKFADEKKGIGAKLSRLNELEKAQAHAKLNPAAYLKQVFGDDWYDRIVQARVNGDAPTGDTVALELERVREEFKGQLDERDKRYAEEQAKAQQASVQAELQRFAQSAADFAAANTKDYPIFETLGDAKAVGDVLVQRIRGEFDRTGKILTMKEAGDALEAQLLSIAEKAASAEKYRERLTPKLKPVQTAAVIGAPQLRRTEVEVRRTLSNDLTASTPGRQPPRNDDERRAAAVSAFNALHR